MPIGVASISFTRLMPGASTQWTCFGRGLSAIAASSPGTKLSRIRVVLPEPDTPVTTVKRPLGIAVSRGLTVWTGPVERWMLPRSNSSIRGQRGRTAAGASIRRNGPIWETGFRSSDATVPWAITRPPSAPAPGPISMIQFAWVRICGSWSTNNTELPSATRSSITAVNPAMLAGCKPIEGSSST